MGLGVIGCVVGLGVIGCVVVDLGVIGSVVDLGLELSKGFEREHTHVRVCGPHWLLSVSAQL